MSYSRSPKSDTPNLAPPSPGWKKDLVDPGRHFVYTISHTPIKLNFKSRIFLEIRRSSLSIRGLAALFGFLFLLLVPVLIYLLVNGWATIGISSKASAILMLPIILWIAVIALRIDLETPLNEPIRFNYARQKLYAYNFKFCHWAAWRPWPIRIVIYDWPQVRAELWSTGSGTRNRCGIMLSIVKLGTNRVIDRFPLNYNNASEDPWLYIHTYMEKGPDALPPFDTPRDPNELVWYSPFRRWAPKVKWPEDIDRESTTAP
ncbi:DUF6708 domain-containing protein [Pseudomonas sp. KNUC1026]|uniref:DUF6708 domain-containing protein n=1 Tax=Pseudomonas sp. KNUC1026 TaxID=2893890 RepID=UPI001F3A79EA|nr:DUF6708 domain-containing protein [Pseudomonas sp. KNUC1026]UFH49442.1 hypothetical protein LN139_21835 [Pseudomonas sp. KNUC1026]